MARRTTHLLLCLAFTVLLAACGGSSKHATKTTTTSPAHTSTRAQRADAGGAGTALAALQLAIRNHDVNGTCASLLPATAARARGSTQALDTAIAAQVRDCEAGFGQRGEFAGYAPLATATVKRIDVRGRFATIEVDSSQGPATVRFLYLRGRWRMLITGS